MLMLTRTYRGLHWAHACIWLSVGWAAPCSGGEQTSDALEPTVPFEVVVSAPAEESVDRLSAEEVRALAGAFNDPFRALDVLPGVTPMVTGLPYYFIRGAPPGNSGYLIDGIAIPQLYHMGVGPSILAPGMVETATLHPGGYSARFGRYSGGVIEGKLAQLSDEHHQSARLLPVDTGVKVEAPLGAGATALLAGRYFAFEPLVKTLLPDVTMSYWDYQGIVDQNLGRGQSLRLFLFGSHDRFGRNDAALSSEFHRGDLRWSQERLDGGSTTIAATLGFDETADRGSVGKIRQQSINLRVDNSQPLGQTQWGAGFDIRVDAYRALAPWIATVGEQKNASPEKYKSALGTRRQAVTGAYTEAVRRWGAFQLRAGVRGDVYTSRGVIRPAFEPRLNARYELTPSSGLEHAFGVAHQPPSFVIPVPGLALSTLDEGLQQSVQHSVTYYRSLPWNLRARTSAFHTLHFNTTDALGLSNIPKDLDHEARTSGRSIGLEFLLRRSFHHTLGGLLSATLLRSTRSVGRYSAASAWDRLLVMNAALSYRLPLGWRMGGRAVFYTGRPPDVIAPPKAGSGNLGDLLDLAREDPSVLEAVRSFQGGKNRTTSGRRRTRPYFRVDARVEKQWQLGDARSITAVLEVLNASALDEEYDLDCTARGCFVDSIPWLPIPNIGIEATL